MPDGKSTDGRSNVAHTNESDAAPGLTTRQGHPVYDNQNNRTVGERGPTLLENYHFLEKSAHFDRGRIPERVVHARGAGAHGYFEAYGSVGAEPVATYTRARLFQEAGKRTPLFIRISTVIHGGHSPETLPPGSSARGAFRPTFARCAAQASTPTSGSTARARVC